LEDDARDPLEVGDVINGRFRVERVLGRGGMGVVVQAMHLPLQEYVAVKLLRAEAAQNERSRARFLREARASARLRSEHVVRLMDFGLYENGSPVIVMEYLEGSDLGARLDGYGRLSVDDTVEYLLQAAEGIAEAHAHGLVHRDLKPGNLFVSRTTDGSALVKVLDFGVSKLSAQVENTAESARLTGASSVVGSPAYMSPEQLSGEATDARTDIWALGVIVFECLTEELPFQGGTVPQLFSAILNDKPPSIEFYRKDVPSCLQALVDSCLQKTPSARCPDTASFAARLVEAAPTPHRLLRVECIARLASIAAESDRPQPPLASEHPEGAVWTRKRAVHRASRLKPRIFVVGAASLVVGVGLFTWTQTRITHPVATDEAPVAASSPVTKTPLAASVAEAPLAASSPVASQQPAGASSAIGSPSASTDTPRVVDGVPAVRTSARTTAPAPSTREPRRKPTPATRPSPKIDPLDGWEPLEEAE